MGKPFKQELSVLPKTYKWAISVDVTHMAKMLKTNSNLPLFSVGSGGSYSAAELQVALHQIFFNSIAIAVTPTELPKKIPKNRKVSIWFISASGNNIDIRRAFKHAAISESKSLSILVGSNNSKLSELAKNFEYCNIFEHKIPSGKDGFLATNSLFAFSILMYRAYYEASFNIKEKLPKSFDDLLNQCIPNIKNISILEKNSKPLWEKEFLHVIYSPNLKSIAVDMESKFTEAGLGCILISDIRNFAHGRHHWFAKNMRTSGILCLTYEEDNDLGQRTINLLPDIPKMHVSFKNNDGAELLAGLFLSFYFTYWKSLNKNIDPGKPGVPHYGSKIYRLTADAGFKSSMSKKEASINRKISHGPTDRSTNRQWELAYDKFTKNLSQQKIGAIVFDYDGTIIDPRRKGEPPENKICVYLSKLIDMGVKIGFATGRGQSIRNELQHKGSFQKKYWSQILIGYYNGAEIGRLSDNSIPNRVEKCVSDLIDIEKFLNENLLIKSLKPTITKRLHQITVESDIAVSEAFLWDIVCDLLNHKNDATKQIRVLRSSHSIDILADYVTKLSVVEMLKDKIQKDQIVLTIGDSGKWPGNDCYLLNTPFSLSVDEVSTAKDRCWNLCSAGIRGPQGLLEYLKRIQKNSKGIFFK